MKAVCLIYVMIRSRDLTPIYAGRTTNPERREIDHVKNAMAENHYKVVIDAVKNGGISFEYVHIVDETENVVNEEFRVWSAYKHLGFPICNKNPKAVWGRREKPYRLTGKHKLNVGLGVSAAWVLKHQDHEENGTPYYKEGTYEIHSAAQTEAWRKKKERCKETGESLRSDQHCEAIAKAKTGVSNFKLRAKNVKARQYAAENGITIHQARQLLNQNQF